MRARGARTAAMRARCGRDAGAMRARCGRDAGAMRARCGRDAFSLGTQNKIEGLRTDERGYKRFSRDLLLE